VTDWEHDRKSQMKRIKQICMFPPSISKRRRTYRKKFKAMDMEKRYASAGPNKHMYEMYNMSIKQNPVSNVL